MPAPARGATSEQKPPSTRTRILEATLYVVAEDGVDGVTHRAVASRAGVSPGSTTHHFASREDLLREAFRSYLRQAEHFMASLLEEAADRELSPLERLERLGCGVVEREFDEERFVRAEYELLLFACTDAELASDVKAWEARILARIAELVEAAGADRPVSAARTVLNVVRGYELERLLDPALTVEDFRERLDLVVSGITARRADAHAPRDEVRRSTS